MRIQRALARAGVASRRKAEELVAAGRVRINGEVARTGQSVEPGRDSITVDGKPTVLRARTGDGSIRVQVQPETRMADAWDISTRDGSVTLTLPTTFDADIDAETGDGGVRSSHPGLNANDESDGDRRRRDLRAGAFGAGRLSASAVAISWIEPSSSRARSSVWFARGVYPSCEARSAAPTGCGSARAIRTSCATFSS